MFVAVTIAIFIVVQGFLYWKGKTPLFVLFHYYAYGKDIGVFTYEGLLFEIAMSLRILCIVCSIPILTMTTPLSTFIVALAKLRVPYVLNFALSTAMRFTPLISKTYEEIVDAQKLSFGFRKDEFYEEDESVRSINSPFNIINT